MTRFEYVGKLTSMNKGGDLPMPKDQLCAILNLIVVARETPNKRVPRVIQPFNNVD